MFRKPARQHLSAEDRLAVLQSADSKRKWESLDDSRICGRCDRLITGRQIDIARDARGRYLLNCPTDGCLSTANDWIYHTSSNVIAEQPGTPPAEFSFFDAGVSKTPFG